MSKCWCFTLSAHSVSKICDTPGPRISSEQNHRDEVLYIKANISCNGFFGGAVDNCSAGKKHHRRSDSKVGTYPREKHPFNGQRGNWPAVRDLKYRASKATHRTETVRLLQMPGRYTGGSPRPGQPASFITSCGADSRSLLGQVAPAPAYEVSPRSGEICA